jgi:hypothetical protein
MALEFRKIPIKTRTAMTISARSAVTALSLCLFAVGAQAQEVGIGCRLEDYSVRPLVYGRVGDPNQKVQVVVLRDPADEQEARFDLYHGAALISLRYQDRELLYAQEPGASVSLLVLRHGPEERSKDPIPEDPSWSAYQPSQAGTGMRQPAVTGGISCHGQNSMRAFTMMVDSGYDSSFQTDPLVGVWRGHVSDTFSPVYSTPFSIETNASWVENPGHTPRYYLHLDQTVVNVRPWDPGAIDWRLEASAPWSFQVKAVSAECDEKKPCISAATPAAAAGRYEDAGRHWGFATVVPTAGWKTSRLFFSQDGHGWATVLARPLAGVGAFRFDWYICAGDWGRAKEFAGLIER